jgi:predicted permease
MKRRAFRLGVGRDHLAHEVDDEIAFHLETKVQRLIASGLTPQDARARALAEFGDRERVRHDMIIEDQQRERAMSRMNFADEARQDLAYALRTMRRNPLFAAIVVLTLGIGIAANTSIFTLVNALLLRPLPVEAPQELVAFGNQQRTSSFSTGSPRTDLYSYPLYRDLRDKNAIMPDIYASGRSPFFMLRTNGDEVDPKGETSRFVSGNFFKVLRVPPMLGRTFDGSEDDNVGGSPYVVISYNLWKRRFGSAGDVIGKRIFLSAARVPMTVIGVTPAWFKGDIVGQPTDVWIPLTMQEVMQPNQKVLADRSANWLLLMGRRPPGMSVERVSAALAPLIQRSIIEHPVPGNPYDSTGPMFIASGARGFSGARANYATPLKTLMAGVVLLLLIICANVANLLLARALARSKEMGVRMAIGAGRQRLVRQLLTESLVLGSLGGAVGLAGAVWGSRMLLRLAADGGSPLPIELGIDLRVLAFTAAIAILAVLLFGFAPALRSSRVDLASAMRASAGAIVSGGGMGTRGQRMPLGRVLIGAQVALSLVLLVGASLLVRSLRELQTSDPGLARDRLLVADVNAVPSGYTQERLVQLAAQIAPRLAAIPGVEAVSYSENGIFWGTESGYTIGTPGFAGKTNEDSSVFADLVGPGYVKAIGGRLLRGRDIGPQDAAGSAPVILINETLAKRFFPERDPIGGLVKVNDSTSLTVVGLIADVKDHSLTEDAGPRMYMAFAQHPADWPGGVRMVIRTSGDPTRVIPQVRAAVEAVDAKFRNTSPSPVSELMRRSISQERLLARLASGFGLLALGLAAIGLYGVMTYAVTRRTAEIGLRVALGAQRGDVVGMILRDAMTVVLAGIAVGIPASLGAARLLQSQLHGIGSSDPVAISIALVVMASSAAIAALSPALRASRLAPLSSLRQE